MKAPLSTIRLVRRGLRWHWRIHATVALGAATATGVLVGALLAGESVTYSLRHFALMRLGRITHAMVARDRLFAANWAAAFTNDTQTAAAALLLSGVAIVQPPDGSDGRQINRVQVLGVDSSFWNLAPAGGTTVDAGTVAINAKLAQALGVAVGDSIGLRIAKPTLMPRNAPLASRKESLAQRTALRVAAIVPDNGLGNFGLQAAQIAPYNAFVNRAWLQALVALEGRANLLLVAAAPATSPADGDDPAGAALDARLTESWALARVGMDIVADAEVGIAQFVSERVFLDPAAGRAALAEGGVGALAYLVNSLSSVVTPTNRTPYSFVTACQPHDRPELSPASAHMRDDEILLSAWTAKQLALSTGDWCRVTYTRLTGDGGFAAATNTFRVRGILAMDRLQAERRLMPDFPGLTDVESCREWDIGMPMDASLLRDPANEAYWKTYGATPKAIVTLAAGQAMWANRFGNLTAVRYPLQGNRKTELAARIAGAVAPSAIGLFFMPLRAHAIAAVENATDLGGYFLGMSGFLIAAALMLTGLLFVFGMQRRADEAGVLLSVGWRPRRVAALFLMEGVVVASIGASVGCGVGIGYTGLLIAGLSHPWGAAVAHSAIRFHVAPGTVVQGLLAGAIAALAPLALTVWHVARHPARDLLQGGWSRADGGAPTRAGWRLPLGASACASAALGMAAWAGITHTRHIAYVFFGAGALLLCAGMGLAAILVRRLGVILARRLTVAAMGMRNAARRRGRSLTAVGLLACGTFMVVAVSSMQENLADHAHARWSGSGGFALFAESTIPVPDPLDSPQTRARFRMQRYPALADIPLVSIKVRDGDDASCLNLNQARAPRLLGVHPADFIAQRAFADEGDVDALWSLFDIPLPPDTVPGLVGDSDTAMWTLKRRTGPRLGDSIAYTDEHGRPFNVKLVGKLPMRLSVFQGAILIARRDFNARYPSEFGYRMFLAAPSPAAAQATQAALQRCFEQVGLEVTPTLQRLQAFYSVEATYLAMFLVLGGLGLLLGSVGMGIVVLRNVLERRGELATLRCLGFTPGQIGLLVMAEHWLLLIAGLLIGSVASLVAIWPNLHAPGVKLPYVTLSAILTGIMVVGIGWIALAARLATRGNLTGTLRAE